jgi:hypothetical protein
MREATADPANPAANLRKRRRCSVIVEHTEQTVLLGAPLRLPTPHHSAPATSKGLHHRDWPHAPKAAAFCNDATLKIGAIAA